MFSAIALSVWAGLWRYSLWMGRTALMRHDAAAAMGWLRLADRLYQKDSETHFLLARASRRLGRVEAFRRHLDRARQLGWPTERVKREWILAQAQVGLLSQAEPHLRRLLISPGEDGPEICAAFANGYAHHYRYHKVIELLDVWQADYPDDPEPYLMRGKLRQKWRHWSEAETEYRSALERAPGSLEVRRRLGEVLAAQHKFDEALVHFETCLADAPDDVTLLTAWAECLMDVGSVEQAEPVFRQLIARNPDGCSARHRLGQIELKSGRVDEALNWLRPAVRDCPRSPDIRYSMALALMAAGERDEAREHFAHSERATEALIRVSNLSAELIRSPGDLDTRFEIGRLVLEHGDAEEGRKWLATVLAVDPQHKATHALLATHFARCGDADQAAEHRRLACMSP